MVQIESTRHMKDMTCHMNRVDASLLILKVLPACAAKEEI